ncbi:MAG TPA: hypothetical protein VKK79_19785 [Candidatus Lokiarchaeia archaeon]|nr:hypothetical protein [Candidatus Lokiarchaeia archaeon]
MSNPQPSHLHGMKFKVLENKIVLTVRDRICETSTELLHSDLFRVVLKNFCDVLDYKGSRALKIFPDRASSEENVDLLIRTFQYLLKIPLPLIPQVLPEAAFFAEIPQLMEEFIEGLYTYWRQFNRFVLCDSQDDDLDERPYRTFNATIEQMAHLVRGTYRDIVENVSGSHPNIFRQLRAGAELGAITKPIDYGYTGVYEKLKGIHTIRQILLYMPLILDPPANKRDGYALRIHENPLDIIDIDEDEWVCFPVKVADLLILCYIHEKFFDLGFSMCNLFELATKDELNNKPNAIFLYGVPCPDQKVLYKYSDPETREQYLDKLEPDEKNMKWPQVFYEDAENDVLVAAIPNDNTFGYFGYLKKMVLTLHNVKKMHHDLMPFHGAYSKLILTGDREFKVLMMGDTGAGKSETLEAFRQLAKEHIQDLIILADDMGSIKVFPDGQVKAFGSEIGAFVRLDDLQPGYTYERIDWTILMSPTKVNSRVVIPVTTYEEINRGHTPTLILYANNYERVIDGDHPLASIANSEIAKWEVDENGNRTNIGKCGMARIEFDDNGNPIREIDENGKTIQEYLDEEGNPKQYPILERFTDPEEARAIFKRGRVMSKGTTTTSGVVQTYFANVFGPHQYQDLHEDISKRYFQAFFDAGIFVGMIRTQLGLKGWEFDGPKLAASTLLNMFQSGELQP